MAVFTNENVGGYRLDFRLLSDGGVALYHAEGVLARDLAWLRGESYVIHEFDAQTWNVEANLHDDVARVLNFPAYYGRNLDALNDCMRDVDVPLDGGMAIVIRNVECAHTGAGRFHQVVDILASAVRDNLLFGRRLLILLQSGDPAITFPPVGAVPVRWNPREWLNSSRGL